MDTWSHIGAVVVLTASLVGGLVSGYIGMDHDSRRVDGSNLDLLDALASAPRPEGETEEPGVRGQVGATPERTDQGGELLDQGLPGLHTPVATPGRRTQDQPNGTVVPTVSSREVIGHHHEHDGGEESYRAYHYTRFTELGLDADYAWEVFRCESDNFDPAVVYGPRTGSLGEIGIGQLKPNGGLLDDFYEQGYGNPWDPYEQIEYISWKVSKEGWWAWTCAR